MNSYYIHDCLFLNIDKAFIDRPVTQKADTSSDEPEEEDAESDFSESQTM